MPARKSSMVDGTRSFEIAHSERADYENVTLIFLLEPIMHPPEGAPSNRPKLAPFWDPVAQLSSS